MSKKQDLFNIFNFIAEFLREEDEISNTGKQLLSERVAPKTDYFYNNDILDKLQNPIENLTTAKGSKHIKDLMDRIDTINRETATSNQILNTQRKNFESELKKIKEEYSDKLIIEKNIDDTIPGETEKSNTETLDK